MGKRKKKTQVTVTRKLLYLGSHLACGVAVILVFLTLIQCTVKKPEAPTWDTTLVIPLVNKTYDMLELIDKIDQDNLLTDTLGNPYFYYENVLDTVTIQGSFAVEDVSRTIAESLGVIQLDPFTGANITVNLGDYVPPLAGDVPPISFDISKPLPLIGEFAIATVESGTALITIENDFGLDLDTVIVTISDVLLGGQLTTYPIPGGIPAGDIRVDTVDLGGHTVSNQLAIALHCHTPGATSFSLSGKSMSTTVSMPIGPSVSSATAKIPRIVKQFTEDVGLTSDHQLTSATLADGQLILDIQNNTNVPANLRITLPDVTDGSLPLVINQPVLANNSQIVTFDLSGYVIQPTDQVVPQTIPVDIEAVIDSSGSQLVTIDAGDRISVTTGLQGLSLSSVAGILDPTTADFDNIQQEIDLPKGFDQVQLPSATLTLEIENRVNIPGTFTINIDGELGQHMVISGTIAPGTPEAPVISTITENDMSAFMNPVPEILTVNGSATFGDGLTSGSVNTDDYITARVIMSSPLVMVIGSASFDGGWESTEIDQSDIRKITENVILARVFTTIDNHLPLGLEAVFYLSGDSSTLYTDPQVTLGPIAVSPGALNPDGTVDTSIISQTLLSLTSEEARVLENNPLWVGQMFTLEGTDGQTVTFTANDSLSVSGYVEIEFTLTKDFWED